MCAPRIALLVADWYDAIVIAGSIGLENYIPLSAWDEMIRLVAPGGLVCYFSLRLVVLYGFLHFSTPCYVEVMLTRASDMKLNLC